MMTRRLTLSCLSLLLFAACKHTPDPEEQERATYQRDLGAAAIKNGNYREALAELLKGEQLNPEDPDVQYALGVTYFTGFGRLKEAEHHLREAVRLRENFSDAENALGNVYMARQECAKAVPLFEHAMSNLLWATPYMAEQNLGWCQYKLGKKEVAVAHLKNAVNTHPTLCGGYDYLAQIYDEAGAFADAATWLEKYVQHCDSDAVRKFVAPQQLAGVHYRLGMAYLKGGEKEKARGSFATCVERFSEQEAAGNCKKNLSLME